VSLYQIYTEELGLYVATRIEAINTPIGTYILPPHMNIWQRKVVSSYKGFNWRFIRADPLPPKLQLLLLITPKEEE